MNETVGHLPVQTNRLHNVTLLLHVIFFLEFFFFLEGGCWPSMLFKFGLTISLYKTEQTESSVSFLASSRNFGMEQNKNWKENVGYNSILFAASWNRLYSFKWLQLILVKINRIKRLAVIKYHNPKVIQNMQLSLIKHEMNSRLCK